MRTIHFVHASGWGSRLVGEPGRGQAERPDDEQSLTRQADLLLQVGQYGRLGYGIGDSAGP
jgi:hypothetical protein